MRLVSALVSLVLLGTAAPGQTFVSSTPVTPTANFTSGDFPRIFRRGTRIVVAFSAKLASGLIPGTGPETEPQAGAYVYREFNEDMTPTGKDGVILCGVKGDNGGLGVGNNFYLALSGVDDPLLDGWSLSLYDSNAWTTLPAPPAPRVGGPFVHKLLCGEGAGDPMLAYVNGQIDVSGTYLGPNCCGNSQPSWCEPSPLKGFTSHHTFFDPTTFGPAPCPPSCHMVLAVPPNPGHVQMTSLIEAGGYINYISSTALLGDLVLMRFDNAWNFVDSKILRPNAWCAQGVVEYDGRYYVSFLDSSYCNGTWPCQMNERLGVFDQAWNAVPAGEVAITSLAKDAITAVEKSSTLLIGDKLYVAYTAGPMGHVEQVQTFVALYSLQPPVMAVSPQTLSFSYTVGGPLPDSQSLSITSTGGGTLSWTASANASWLTVSPASGATPATLSVSVNPAGLSPATYTGTVQITANGSTGGPISVPVTLVVQARPPAVSISSALDGAGFQAGVSPGAWIAIFGANLASTTRLWRLDEIVSGRLPTQLDGVSVSINGKPAAVYYISPVQLNVQAPDDTATGSVTLAVTSPHGTATTAVTMQPVSPRLVHVRRGEPEVRGRAARRLLHRGAGGHVFGRHSREAGRGDRPVCHRIRPDVPAHSERTSRDHGGADRGPGGDQRDHRRPAGAPGVGRNHRGGRLATERPGPAGHGGRRRRNYCPDRR